MTSFTLQNESSAPSYSNQSKNTSSFSLQARDQGRSSLLKEDGSLLETEDGFSITLEQATIGDMWISQPKS